MRSGNLNNRIKFYAKVSTRDIYNSSIDSWPVATITTRGEVRYVGGNKELNNDEKFYSKAIELTVRYRSDIVETMRVQIDDKSDWYSISYMEILGRNEGLRLTLDKLGESLTPVIIDPPTNLSVSLLEGTDLLLTWNCNINNDSVSIERSTDGINYTQIAIIDGETYTDKNLNQSTRYFYRIRSYNQSNYSAYTTIDDATTSIYAPSELSIAWDEDYCEINFTDNSKGIGEHQIWSQRTWWNGTDEWELVTTLPAGVTSYIDRTWQNSSVEYKIRGVSSGIYTDYCSSQTIKTPWVFKMDQTTLQTVKINDIHLYSSDKLVVIDWGDGTSTNVTAITTNPIQKNYTTTGKYFVTLTGDLDSINYFHWDYPVTYTAGTDITKWTLPFRFQASHLKLMGMVGVATNILYPPQLAFLDWDNNNFSEWNLTNFHIPSNVFEFNAMTSTFDNTFGDISTLRLPDTLAHLNLKGFLYGDLTNVIPFKNIYYGNAYARLESSHPVGLTGDLSNWILPDTPGGGHITMMRGTHFTKMPRGHFRRITNFGFYENSCDSAEIDSLLQYVDNYFTGDVVPLVDCTYILNGNGMGSPSAVGLAAKASIEGKYSAAGVTATISVNQSVLLCDEYIDVLNAMVNKPSLGDQVIQNEMLKALVDGGYYAKAELIDIFATHSETESLFNWKDVTKFNPTKFNSPVWEQYAGYTGNALNAYIKTNFNPSTNGTLIGQNNVCIVFGINTDVFENGDDVFSGAAATSPIGCKTRDAVSNGYIRGYCNDSTQTAIVNTNAIGHYAYSRGSSNGYDVYKNSTRTYVGNASVAMASLPIDLIRSTKQMSYFMLFKALTEAEVQDVMNIMERYLDYYNKGLR